MSVNLPVNPPATEAGLRILLVKLKHIGDALLMTPTLVALRTKYPNAEIWVVVRKGTEGILAGCGSIDRLLTVTPIESGKRGFTSFWNDFRTWLTLRRQRFDYAFELTDGDRGRWLAGMSGSRHRCVNVSHYALGTFWKSWFNRVSDSEWTNGHRVEKDYHGVGDFLPLDDEIPSLCFESERAAIPEWSASLPSDFVIFHPGTRWIKKRWPREYWIRLGESLLERTDCILISCGPDEQERRFARELVEALGEERCRSTDGRCNWAELAGLLYRARLFVGVDTAAMHLAAACQCPIVTMFCYSVVSQWRPWQAPHEILHLGDKMPLPGKNQRPSEEIMRQLTPEMALAAAERLMRRPSTGVTP